MLLTLLTIALPIAPLLLVIKGKPFARQVASVAGAYLILCFPNLPGFVNRLQMDGMTSGMWISLLLQQATNFGVFALSAWAQTRWRRLFLPRVTKTLFWILVASIPLNALLTISINASFDSTGSFISTAMARTALWISQLTFPVLNLAFYGFALILAVGLLLLIPVLSRKIRYAL